MSCRFLDMRSCQRSIAAIPVLRQCFSHQGNNHRCPQSCGLREVASANCGQLARWPHCVPTQLWPSQGSSRNPPSWLRFHIRLRAAPGNLCQVSSVSAVGLRGVRLLFCSSRAVSATEIYTSCNACAKLWLDISLKLGSNHTRQSMLHNRLKIPRSKRSSQNWPVCAPRVTKSVFRLPVKEGVCLLLFYSTMFILGQKPPSWFPHLTSLLLFKCQSIKPLCFNEWMTDVW